MVSLVRDPLGYLRVDPLPTHEDLALHYRASYYGGDKVNSYSASYEPEELEHKALRHQEALHLWQAASRGHENPATLKMLDAGCGEGFSLAGFAAAGWSVTGVDFTPDGVRAFNPTMEPRLVLGDLFACVESLARAGERFDMVLCNNVLEHVIDPRGCLELLRGVVAPGGMLRIEVPHDGSWLQADIVERGLATEKFWVAYPDHLSYFTLPPLVALGRETGWRVAEALGDFPVDLYLLNRNSNYVLDRSKGKEAHRARVHVEVTVARQGMDRFIALRRSLAGCGLCRSLIVYFQPAEP